MALSFFTENEAPRDFRVSSTESESHYTKCLLCYTIKKSFYCVDCIKAGNFIHSSMPYSDRFADKQSKLVRLKANRNHVQDRCENLLAKKSKKDSIQIAVKLCKDKVELIKLAIEQRKHSITEKKKQLQTLKQSNTELSLKLPRYQKRVSSLGKHAQLQKEELQNKMTVFEENVETLAALRRARIRQLNKYIIPVYITYDTSESVDDMEFLQVSSELDDEKLSTAGSDVISGDTNIAGTGVTDGARERIHFVSAWLPADGDLHDLPKLLSARPTDASDCPDVAARARAALSLATQLAALAAWITDLRLPPRHAPELAAACTGGGGAGCARRTCGAALQLAARGGVLVGGSGAVGARPLVALGAVAAAARAEERALGRQPSPLSTTAAATLATWGARCGPNDGDEEPPECLSWPDVERELEELGATPPPAPSLVTSAAASLASIWRGWTK